MLKLRAGKRRDDNFNNLCFYSNVDITLDVAFNFGKFFKQQFQERLGMNKDKIKVNDHTYSVALNEQTQMYTRKLRGLYQQGSRATC
jgi:hypothetical protein